MQHIRFVVVVAIAAFATTAAWADPPLPQVSQTGVFRTDVVAASQGSRVLGSPSLAVRNETTVHYLATKAHQDGFATQPTAYPDIERGITLALMGADPVLRFPNGVHDPSIGAIIAGDPARYVAEHKGAWYAFASEATLNAFKSDPEQYSADVGGYCLGAMSRHGITPGDPRNVFFVPEENKWAVYGSPNGPAAWLKMTAQERRSALAIAHAYYNERVGAASMPIPAVARMDGLLR